MCIDVRLHDEKWRFPRLEAIRLGQGSYTTSRFPVLKTDESGHRTLEVQQKPRLLLMMVLI